MSAPTGTAPLRRWTGATLAATFGLVVLGGLVRATESGLGCGDDWPRCSGRVIPAGDHHTWIEFAHRSVAAVVAVMAVTLAVVAWRSRSASPLLRRLAYVTVPLVLVQAAVGAVVVNLELEAASVVVHLGLAMALLAVLVAALVVETLPTQARTGTAFGVAAWGVALGALGVMLLGSYVSGREAGLAYTTWPLFDGGVVPDERGNLGLLHGLHRYAAAASGLSVAALWWRSRTRTDPTTQRLVLLGGLAFALQILLGAANVLTDLSSVTRTMHLAVGAAIWALLVTAALRGARAAVPTAPSSTAIEAGASRPGALATAHAYLMLTKPRVVELLLVTTVPAMVLAEGGLPSLSLVAAVLLGGALAAGGANTINCYIDRDRDAAMRRTRGRPLPTGKVDPNRALVFGLVLEASAFAFLWWSANLLAASLAVGATAFYVFVYSIWLKPRTAQNIVIGGAAGAVPVLVGWAAVTSDLASPAWVLFAIIFVWTPPHFWALSMRYRDDYAAAGVPMMPVVAGVDATTRQILAYAVVVVATTLLLQPVARLGLLYVVAAVGLGTLFVRRAVELRRDASPGAAMRMFAFSNVYLALLFAAVALDVLAVSGG